MGYRNTDSMMTSNLHIQNDFHGWTTIIQYTKSELHFTKFQNILSTTKLSLNSIDVEYAKCKVVRVERLVICKWKAGYVRKVTPILTILYWRQSLIDLTILFPGYSLYIAKQSEATIFKANWQMYLVSTCYLMFFLYAEFAREFVWAPISTTKQHCYVLYWRIADGAITGAFSDRIVSIFIIYSPT